MIMKKIGLAIVYFLAAIVYLQADMLTLFLNQNATDNLFQTAFSESDHVSSLGFSLDKDLGGVSLFAEGSLSYLYENPDLTYTILDLGLDHVWVVGETSGLYLSLTGRGAFYRSEFSDFNYGALNAYGAFKSYLTPTSILKADYALTLRDYRWSQFDYVSQSLNVTMDKFFQSRTTLKAGLGWGFKYYPHPFDEGDVQALGEDSDMGMDLNTRQGMGQGMGRGKPAGSDSLSPVPPQASQETGGQGIQTLALSALVAQGLGDHIGVQVTGLKQWPLSGENPFMYVWEFYMVENPFYDRFSWAGHELGAQVTLLLPADIQAKLGYGFSQKEFPGVEVMDDEGNATGVGREDTRHHWQVRFSRDFHRFSLMLTYNFINNGSNDPLFDWQGNYLALGIEWNLFLGEKQ